MEESPTHHDTQKEELKSKITVLLRQKHENSNKGYINILPFLSEYNFFLVKEAVKELETAGQIEVDQTKWPQNEVFIKLAPSFFRKLIQTSKISYEQRTWLIAVSAIATVSFSFLFVLNLYNNPLTSSPQSSQGNLTGNTALEVIEEHLKKYDSARENYEIEEIRSEEGKVSYRLSCKSNKNCLFAPSLISLEKYYGLWEISHIENLNPEKK